MKGCVAVFLVALLGVGVSIFVRNIGEGEVEASKVPLFTFDAARAPGWHRAGLDNAAREGRTSLLLFDRTMPSSEGVKTAQSCHVSAHFREGLLDASERFSGIESDEWTRSGSHELSLRVGDDEKRYVLSLYQKQSEQDTGRLKGGYAFGYVSVDAGYVEIRAVCDTAVALQSSISAIKAIHFNDTMSRE